MVNLIICVLLHFPLFFVVCLFLCQLCLLKFRHSFSNNVLLYIHIIYFLWYCLGSSGIGNAMIEFIAWFKKNNFAQRYGQYFSLLNDWF